MRTETSRQSTASCQPSTARVAPQQHRKTSQLPRRPEELAGRQRRYTSKTKTQEYESLDIPDRLPGDGEPLLLEMVDDGVPHVLAKTSARLRGRKEADSKLHEELGLVPDSVAAGSSRHDEVVEVAALCGLGLWSRGGWCRGRDEVVLMRNEKCKAAGERRSGRVLLSLELRVTRLLRAECLSPGLFVCQCQ